VLEKIRRDVIDQIMEQCGRRNAHHEPTTGVDTSVVDDPSYKFARIIMSARL
jgi:hypothetical protein